MRLPIMRAMVLLISTQITFASPPAKPNKCPSVSILQAIGITTVVYDGHHWYAGVRSNHYATNEEWSFSIEPIKATNKDDAEYKATNIVNTLTFKKGPELFKFDEKYSWACYYNDYLGHLAYTITPSIYPTFYL